MNDIFIANNTSINFLDKIKDSINKCNKCLLSVSFIKKAGLVLFENNIEQALKRGTEIKIITSTYQNFTDIASLELFNNWQLTYPNFECHLDYESFRGAQYSVIGYHSKGYLTSYATVPPQRIVDGVATLRDNVNVGDASTMDKQRGVTFNSVAKISTIKGADLYPDEYAGLSISAPLLKLGSRVDFSNATVTGLYAVFE